MEGNTQMRSVNAIICGVLTFAAIAVCCHGGTATPFDASKVDFSKIPDVEAQMQATIAHRNALHQQLLDQVLPAASDDVKAAVDKAQNLQKEIDKQALQAARVPVLEAELTKAHKACWRNLLIGAVIGAIGALIGPKLIGLATLIGV
jgi:ribosomal protein L17